MSKSTWDRIVEKCKAMKLELTEQKRYVRIQARKGKDVRRIYLPLQHEPTHLDVAGWVPSGESQAIVPYEPGKQPSGAVLVKFVPAKATEQELDALLLELDGDFEVELKKGAARGGKARPSLS